MSRSRLCHAVAWILLALLAQACAAPPTEEEIDAELRRIAAGVTPLRGELRVVPFEADSRMDAWADFVDETAEGKGREPSGQARWLARVLAQASRRRIAVVTGGPYASLNESAARDAFELVKEKTPRLPGLTLVYVSPEPPTPELRAAVARAGGLLVHRTPAPR